MVITQTSQNAIWPCRAEYHVLTYAEEGFAPLNIHTRDTALSKDRLIEFAALINDRNEVGTLFPIAAVSAVPRAAIRELQDSHLLRQCIEDFFRVNAQTILAKKVILDFRTPSVPPFVITAIQDAIACPSAVVVEEIVVIDDAAL